MTSLVRRYLKTAILFLFVGLALGAWMIVQREITGVYPLPYVVSAHTHAILVGFVMQMILGVALWMFPRPEKDGVGLFFRTMWSRIRGVGSRAREASGEQF